MEQLVDGGQIPELHAESVGTSSRRSDVRAPAARAPTSSTASWSIFSVDDARGHVRDDRDGEAADAQVARRDDLGHGRHPDEVGAGDPQEADLGGRLELRAEPRRVDALGELDAEPGCRRARRRPELRVVRVAQIREARPELVVVRPDERRGALEVQVVGDENELTGPKRGVDPHLRRSSPRASGCRAGRGRARRRRPALRRSLRTDARGRA